eukprot:CAMPEP_0171692076 /NCGR_PEP_ID=MMETSP0991-20121206/5881_1 /TAXON_ID=483369 /ORGANISM="non described non described, Strain CCMP2098" /LENGTH=561 /DNA_ID=CAMNT_0012280351 /DNA_START=103 /DNA_END=1788 /DNA_ORIENTATION=-
MADKNKRDKKLSSETGFRECAYCGVRGGEGTTLSNCSRCGVVAYCSRPCQRKHWKAVPGHKEFCVRPEDRRPALQPVGASVLQTGGAATPLGEECAICLEPLTPESSLTLRCAHVFHLACVGKLRKLAKNACPMCRGELPLGPEQTFYEALDRYMVLVQRVARGEASWGALTEAEQQEMAEVHRMLHDAGGQGHGRAQFLLGLTYEDGQGTQENLPEAAKWYRKAATQGFPEAQHCLGLLLSKGKGVPESQAEAFKWLSKAANQGVRDAQADLGVCYRFAQGTRRDNAQALKWFRKAADKGNALAQYNLGCMVLTGEGAESQDSFEAARWFRKAAVQGQASAQYNLAALLREGDGVEQDLAEAVSWYLKGAKQGDAECQYSLAKMYVHGMGVKHDYAEAVNWYEKAVAQNCADSQLNLGILYFDGTGVKKDIANAVELYTRAADQGNVSALSTLASVYEHGPGPVQKNLAKATELYKEAAKQGFEPAIKGLARIRSGRDESKVPIVVGARVRLRGLQNNIELNSAAGVVVGIDLQTSNFSVKLDGGKGTFKLKLQNLSKVY